LLIVVLTLAQPKIRWLRAPRNLGTCTKAVLVLFLFILSSASLASWISTPVYAPPAATLSEWTVPTGASGPWGLALDPSGTSLWFLEYFGNKLAHLDPSSGTFQEWPLPTGAAQPYGIATTTVSGQTAVLGTEFATNKIFLFFPSTGVFSEYQLPNAGSGPTYISVEPPGTFIRSWFSETTRNVNAELIIDPGTLQGTLYETTYPGSVGGGSNGVFAGAGVIWFAGNTALVRWDRSTGQYTIWPLPTHGSAGGRFLVLDSLGQAWYTQGVTTPGGTDNYVGVLRGDNTIKEWQVPTIGSDPRGISFNAFTQHPWFGEDSATAGNSRVAELDPSGGGSVVGSAPTTVAIASVSAFVAPTTYGPVGPSSSVSPPTSGPNTGVPNGQFTEWALAANSQAHDVLVDLSGNTWLVEAGGNKIGRLSSTTPDFGLSASPSPVSIAAGSSGSVTVTGTSIFSFSGPVTLSITGSTPSGVTFSTFSPNPISIPSGGTSSASLGITVSSSATVGSSAITVSGSGSSGIHTTSFILNILPAMDFSMSLSAPALSIGAGGSSTDTVTVTSLGGFNSAVALSTTALPAGVHVSFSPSSVTPPGGGSVTSTATVSIDPGTLAGLAALTFTSTSGSLMHSSSLALTILGPSADFSMSLGSTSLSVGPGSSATDAVTVTSIGTFNSAVALSASGLPSGVHASFSPASVTPPAGGSVTSTATISVDSGTPTGVATVTITGAGGSLTHSALLTLTIAVIPDFTIAANPNSLTIAQGASGTSTITVGSVNGFSSSVALSYSWVGSAPAGVTVSVPGPVTPPSGSSATSTLTVSTTSATSAGTLTLQVAGTAGSLNHAVSVTIDVTAAAAPKCLIATATYGSELAPEVQLLRNFRDNSILKTQSGSSFMIAFNAWYYSFSPYVAAYLNTHLVERTVMKGVLYPLIGILYLTSNLFSATAAYPELAALLSGLLASSLIGAFYLGLPLAVLRARIRRLRNWKGQGLLEKSLATILACGLGALLVGELYSSQLILMLSTATIILSTLFASSAITSNKVSKRLQSL
jgi:streptogramin lyase